MEHKFEPFERVLARADNDYQWQAVLFSHYDSQQKVYRCSGDLYKQCIPYGGNEHLLGTTDSPEPKHEYKWGDKVEVRPKDIWVKALYERNDTQSSSLPSKHKVLGHNGAYGDLSNFIFYDNQIRPLKDE